MTSDIGHRRTGWLGWLVVAAAILMGAQAIWAQHQQSQQSHARAEAIQCLSTWASQFATALDARVGTSTAPAQAAHDQAVDDVLLAVLDGMRSGSVDDNELRTRLEAFQQADAALDKARQTNATTAEKYPYPPPPRDCIT